MAIFRSRGAFQVGTGDRATPQSKYTIFRCLQVLRQYATPVIRQLVRLTRAIAAKSTVQLSRALKI